MIRHFEVPGGIRVVGDVLGDPAAPPVILLHGGGQTRHSWHAATSALVQEGYHVINLDARGHGDSDWSPTGDYSIASMAKDLCAVIATLVQRPALVGASMGAAASMLAVGTSREAIARALVLVDFVPDIEMAGARRIGDFMQANPEGFATLDEAADAVSAYYPHRPRPRDHSGLMKNLRRRADGRLHWHWDPAFVARSPRAEPPQFKSDLRAAARQIHIPTLLVRGLLSDIVSDDGVARLREAMPTLEVFEVADAAHMVAGDRNDKFNQAVVAFLQRQMPGHT